MLRLAHICIVSLIDCNDCIQKDCSHSLNWNVLQDLLSIFWGLFIKSLLYTFMNLGPGECWFSTGNRSNLTLDFPLIIISWEHDFTWLYLLLGVPTRKNLVITKGIPCFRHDGSRSMYVSLWRLQQNSTSHVARYTGADNWTS